MKVGISRWGVVTTTLFCCALMACNPDRASNTPFHATTTAVQNTPTAEPLLFGEGGFLQRDIQYCAPDGLPQYLDLYFPKTRRASPTPVLLFMHQAFDDKAQIRFAELRELLARGYVIAAVNAREPSTYKWPTVVRDTQCAVRFLRAHARVYDLDSARFGAWGCSEGGYQAAMLGVEENVGAGADEYAGISSRVQAAVVEDGIADMHDYAVGAYEWKFFFGVNSGQDPILARASPITHVSSDDAPFLIFASDSDSGFWRKQGEKLHAGLAAAHVPTQLVVVKNAQHCWTSYGFPTAEEIAAQMGDFFDRHLSSK